ncbi:MAG: hypothetical protein DRH70_06050 [Candidatus Coatesbacteria bacterium]|nr:MAG: hypothetical protein DRH70_06050 [Candidatus Coatesbacteria bacterium]
MTDALEPVELDRTEGYFTPSTVAEFMISNSEVRKDARIIDPAAGDGTFIQTLLRRGYRRVWGIEVIEARAAELRERMKAYNGLSILSGDALDLATLGSWSVGTFDVAIGNPPFSYRRSRVSDERILANFELGRPNQAIEILFLERFVQLVRPSGLIRIILPMNIFANTTLQYVRDFILENLWIEAVVALPRHTFGGTSAKTAILFGQKRGKSWGVRGDLWNQKRVKLVSVPDVKSLPELAKMTIDKTDEGLLASMTEIQTRMDPDYHFARAETSRILESSKVPFAPLGELADVHTGFFKYGDTGHLVHSSVPRKKPERDKYIRLLKAKNLSIYGFRFGVDDFFIRKDEELFRPWACVNVGDVMVVRVGAGCVGRATCVIDERYKGQADDWMLIVEHKRVNPAYLAFYLNSSIGRTFVMREAQGTGTLSISKGKLLKVQVPMLLENEQSEFEAQVKKMYDAHRLGKLDKAKSIFASLEKRLKLLVFKQ